MGKDFAGIVILYNPEDKILDNIKTYVNELDILYVVDNSERLNNSLIEILKKMDKVKYVTFGENKGIAYPINFILEQVRDYRFLLTMDQDSCFEKGMIGQYKEYVEVWHSKEKNIAVFSANNTLIEHQEVYKFEKRVMTSGNIIDVAIARMIGGFDENLFIDEVDHEFCYRLTNLRYKILSLYSVKMEHHLGNIEKYNVYGVQFNSTNHNMIRRYYMTRNMLYVMGKYPEVKMEYLKRLLKMIVKIILVEDGKVKKLTYIIKGFSDYIYRKFGKYEN